LTCCDDAEAKTYVNREVEKLPEAVKVQLKVRWLCCVICVH